jgi:hypothetical protein
VKLVDTPASGAGGRKAVKVQVLSSVPHDTKAQKNSKPAKPKGLAGFLLPDRN